MCTDQTPFVAEPAVAPDQTSGPGRRDLLRVAAAGGGAIVLSGAAGAPWAQAATLTRTRVYVIVLDGCRPDEITSLGTPKLYGLRQVGRWYPNARSLPVMETIPNHVMMMTGVRPDRNGVPANAIYDRSLRTVRDLDKGSDITFPTIFGRAHARGLTTATVLSKKYLYGVFGTRATYRWEPSPLVPVTNHAPDVFTYEALVAMVDRADPDLVFVNLGDIDRVGHSDLGGSINLGLARKTALLNTDTLVSRFVTHLRDTGRWSSSVLLFLADHSMDWSIPTNVVSLGMAIAKDATLKGKVQIAQNGGADLLYWTGPSTEKTAGLSRLRQLVLAQRGVLSVHTPGELRLSSRAGDLVAYCKAGWRFSDPSVVSNPIPGNHGHPATAPIPFFLSGGSPKLTAGVMTGAARTVDVAPTVSKLLGIPAPSGGYDGIARV